jgi:N-acetyl-gamma-glutamyl-phosphate reductase
MTAAAANSPAPGLARATIGLVGVPGYAGQLLLRLLERHPWMTPRVAAGRTPHDAGASELRALAGCDAVALALPGEAAREWTSALRDHAATRILDLSDAERCTDGVHYGLPELFGPPPPNATLVANPGCYPTASLLALRPLLDPQLGPPLIEPTGVAIHGCSGASGAGKGLRDDLHFCELHGNAFPYKVGQHRHIPEIERHLGAPISFVTTLLPVVRGLSVTAFVRPTVEPAALLARLEQAYATHPYVSVLREPGLGLGLRHVVGTHQGVVAVGPVERSGLVPVFATIDNLMRGAASQALHNLNLWLAPARAPGVPELAAVQGTPAAATAHAFAGLPAPLDPPPTGVPGTDLGLV